MRTIQASQLWNCLQLINLGFKLVNVLSRIDKGRQFPGVPWRKKKFQRKHLLAYILKLKLFYDIVLGKTIKSINTLFVKSVMKSRKFFYKISRHMKNYMIL